MRKEKFGENWCRQTSLGEVCDSFVVKGSRAYHRATIYIYIYMYTDILMYIVAVCLCWGPHGYSIRTK